MASFHSLTAALDQLRVVASSTSNDPGPLLNTTRLCKWPRFNKAKTFYHEQSVTLSAHAQHCTILTLTHVKVKVWTLVIAPLT